MKSISVLAYPGCQLLDVCGPLQVFASANNQLDKADYKISISAATAGPFLTNSGITLIADQAFDASGVYDTLLIAGGSGVFSQFQNHKLLADIKQQSQLCRRLGSVCTGAFLLAACGLLDNHRAVTHWQHCTQLQQQYPQIQVEADALYLCDQGIYTSAGVTAGIDLALALVAEDLGHELASQVARELVVFMHRPGGQAQFSGALQQQTTRALAAGPVSKLLEYIHNHPRANLSIEYLAEHIGLSSRHLTRLFRQQLGQTAASYIEEYRLTLAQDLLARTSQKLENIADNCGFTSADQLRRVMQRKRRISPTEYRQRFAENHGAVNTGTEQ
ncbi:MAG: helix-turn-helix domain-containing protein [Motiliproteus sp.]